MSCGNCNYSVLGTRNTISNDSTCYTCQNYSNWNGGTSRIDIIGQNGNTGEHYREVPQNSYGNWEVGDFIYSRNLDFFQGNIVKYVDRFRRKNGKEDLLKARTYLDKLIELEYNNAL